MARTKAELLAECVRVGVKADSGCSKDTLMDKLRDHYLESDSYPIQIDLMLARDAKDFLNYDLDKPWLSNSMFSMFWGRADEWVMEEKLDGCRFRCHITSSGLRFDSRRRSDVDYAYSEKTSNFPHLSGIKIPELEGTVLDGEIIMPFQSIDSGSVKTQGTLGSTIVVVNSGPDVACAIQDKYGYCEYRVFDVIMWKGKRVDHLVWSDRFALLWDLLECLGGDDYIKTVRSYACTPEAYESVIESGLEGVMFKLRSGKYECGKRSPSWYKLKKFVTFDGFITGYVPGDGGNAGKVGSLCISAYDQGGKLFEFASVSNMTDYQREKLSNPDGSLDVGMYYQVVEVMGQEITKNSRIRHARMLRTRSDKSHNQCKVLVEPGNLTQL